MKSLSDLRIADLEAFLAVQRSISITGAARELKVTPSQVSKAIVRLESQLHLQLLVRTSRGISISEPGRRIVPMLEEILRQLRTIVHIEEERLPEINIAAASYLNLNFVPNLAAALPDTRIRTLEIPPASIRAWAADFFDIILSTGIEKLGGGFVSVEVGAIRKGLFARPSLAKTLGPNPVAIERLKEVPFVGPLYNANGHFIPVDDGCPIGFDERRRGHEAQTIAVALELAAVLDQLVFGPVLAARAHLDAGRLVEISVDGWAESEPLYVACHIDRVRKSVQLKAVESLRATLQYLNG